MESLLPLTDFSRFVLFILSYICLHGGLTGTHGGTHLYTLIKITLVMVRERVFVQKSLTCGIKLGAQVEANLSELTQVDQVKRLKDQETERLPPMSRNKTSSTQNTHLSYLPVYPPLIVSVYNSLILSQVGEVNLTSVLSLPSPTLLSTSIQSHTDC